jgi:predicted phosphodiesterase
MIPTVANTPQLIAAFGDIHAEDDTLAAGLAHVEALGADLIVSVGDVCDGRGSVDRTVELLRKHRVVTVAGNHERWLLEGVMRDLPGAHLAAGLRPATLKWISELPRQVEFAVPGGDALLCHGLGPHDMAGVKPDDEGYALASNSALHAVLGGGYSLVVNGHTHQRMARRFSGTLVVNAGTLVREQDPGFVLIDFGNQSATFMGFYSPSEIRVDFTVDLSQKPAQRA